MAVGRLDRRLSLVLNHNFGADRQISGHPLGIGNRQPNATVRASALPQLRRFLGVISATGYGRHTVEEVGAVIFPRDPVIGPFVETLVEKGIAPLGLGVESARRRHAFHLAGLGILLVHPTGTVHCVKQFTAIVQVRPVMLQADLNPKVFDRL